MAKKSALPILLGVGVIGAGAAVFLTGKKAMARPTPSGPPRPTAPVVPTLPPGAPTRPSVTTRPPPTPKPRPPTLPRPKATPATQAPPKGTANRIIGDPYRIGRANERRNAAIAVNRNPKTHPNGKQRFTRAQDVWLADVAYWETNDKGPLVINPERATHKKYKESWARIYAHVKEFIAKKRAEKAAKEAKEKAARDAAAKAAKPKPPPPAKPVEPAGPKIPDRAAEIRNADYAVRHEPTRSNRASPYDKQRGTSAKSHRTWLINWAYWQTYPTGPTKLVRGTDKDFIQAWLRIRNLFDAGWAAKQKAELPPPPPPAPSPPPPKKRTPAPAPASLPPPTISTSKGDLAAAAEARNAALVVTQRPTTYPRLNKKYGGGKYRLDYWLTNVAYWSTYPEGPTKLAPKDATHKPYIAAWVRIFKYVKGMLALSKKLPKETPLAIQGNTEANRNWIAWALAMWASSGLRTADQLADTYVKATRYLAQTASGKKVLRRDIGTKAGPVDITGSGLTAAAAIRVPTGELTAVTNWRKKPSRSFWTANGIY